MMAPMAAPYGAHLSYYGGPVVSNAEVTNVYWGTGTYGPQAGPGETIPAFINAIGASGYFDFLNEYNPPASYGTGQTIGHAHATAEHTITPHPANASATIYDANMQNELVTQWSNGTLPSPTFDSLGYVNTIYAVLFPSDKTLISSTGSRGGISWCAYHSTIDWQGHAVPYMVLPAFTAGSNYATGCGADPALFNNFTSTVSHELVESVTDPAVGLAAGYYAPLGWYDRTFGEIADICPGQQRNVAGYVVQAEFSNRLADCVYQTGDGFTPTTPTRIVDSRSGSSIGRYSTPWMAGSTRPVESGGVASVPIDADAVVLNVTVTGGSAASFLTLWPSGQARPNASSLNWAAGVTIPNSVTVKLGSLGRVSVFNGSGTVNVIIDSAGFFA